MIERIGLYDEELVRNQDDEYNYQIRELNGKLLLASDVHSTYYSRGSLSKLWKQYYQYGFYKIRVLQKHPLQMSIRQFIPPLFVTSLIATLLLAFVTEQGINTFRYCRWQLYTCQPCRINRCCFSKGLETFFTSTGHLWYPTFNLCDRFSRGAGKILESLGR